MVGFLEERGISGRTVLETGGGIGEIQLELLRAGAERTVNLELSPNYERIARELLREAGFEDRVERRLVDIAEQPAEVAPADAVVMHRVVCCYPDMPKLVGAAADQARRFLVLSYPREAWWMRLGIAVANFLEWLRRRSFRAYVHSPAAILAVARRRGLEPALEHRGLVWQVAALERVG